MRSTPASNPTPQLCRQTCLPEDELMHESFPYDAKYHRPISVAAAGHCSQHGLTSCTRRRSSPSRTRTTGGSPVASARSTSWSLAARSRRLVERPQQVVTGRWGFGFGWSARDEGIRTPGWGDPLGLRREVNEIATALVPVFRKRHNTPDQFGLRVYAVRSATDRSEDDFLSVERMWALACARAGRRWPGERRARQQLLRVWTQSRGRADVESAGLGAVGRTGGRPVSWV